MVEDYGARRVRQIGLKRVLIGCGALVAIAVLGIWLARLPQAVTRARAWAISGPPCQTQPRRVFDASVVKPREAFEFDDVTFIRGYGHASCTEIVNDGGRGIGTFPECQFTSPAVLQVTTGKGDFYFLPGAGPATVSVHHGEPSCVRAGWFKGERSVPGE